MLPAEVKERLDLLVNSKQIEPDTRKKVWESLSRLERKGHLDPTSESIGPFTNHLAIAVERISKGEPITDINEQVNEVVRDHPGLNREAEKLLRQCIQDSDAEITSAETGFVALYLALLRRQPDMD